MLDFSPKVTIFSYFSSSFRVIDHRFSTLSWKFSSFSTRFVRLVTIFMDFSTRLWNYGPKQNNYNPAITSWNWKLQCLSSWGEAGIMRYALRGGNLLGTPEGRRGLEWDAHWQEKNCANSRDQLCRSSVPLNYLSLPHVVRGIRKSTLSKGRTSYITES